MQIRFCVFLFCVMAIFSACSKKQQILEHDVKTQVESKTPDISFATTRAESNKWYKLHFSPILKNIDQPKLTQEYEDFAKLYFADLSQVEFQDKMIDSTKLLPSVFFTHFAKEMLKEYIFISIQDGLIAPWDKFGAKISLNGVVSASFVAQVSQSIKYLENESYENFNTIALAVSLLKLTQRYAVPMQTSLKTKDITTLGVYQLPDSLYSFLFYKILYSQFFEKFQSNFLLDMMARNFPKKMLLASNTLLHTRFVSNEIEKMQKHFMFPAFENTSLLSITQCKAGASNHAEKNSCIQEVFLPWIMQMQDTLRKEYDSFFFPIFSDSKLCMLVWYNKIRIYPGNTESFCRELHNTLLKKYPKTRS